MRKRILLLIIYSCVLNIGVWGQDKYSKIQERLFTLSAGDIPALNERVNISVTNVPIQEFLRGVAANTGLNINVEPGLKIDVINNFSNVKVIDILLFLCRQYDLNITAIGNIINIFREKPEALPAQPRKALVTYDKESGLVSIQCENDDLINLAREMIDKTGTNVIPAPGLDKTKVNGYIQNVPLNNALEKFAYTNNLKIKKTDDQAYLIERNDQAQVTAPLTLNRKDNALGKKNVQNDGNPDFQVKRINNSDSLLAYAQNASVADIIKEAASQLKVDYYLASPITGEATFTLKRVTFPSLLQNLFQNSNFAYQQKNGVYVISDNKSSELKDFKVIQLQNRTIDTLLTIVPADLKKDLEIKTFVELNSVMVGGLPEKIMAFEKFLRTVDVVVPVISIEVMIIDLTKSHITTTGIETGIKEKATTTTGKVFPETDINLGATSINNLINSFNGFGSIKIGKVTPNFYMTLKALQTNGIINIRSTPKLSTLNGHSASLAITNTEYYQEQQNSIYGSITSQSTVTTTYKDVKAEMSVKIRPVVSGNDQITLDIEVNQEDFTTRISQYAPPGKTARKFKSLIRVKNQEMVLLGGLEQKRDNDTSSGIPVLSRIPILKWLFSSKSKTQSNEKLEIFIKPTIID
ncbi:MAG: type II and III secretion system protein [Bacteroidota bacterium]|nr:type II and III secretion system protein [Bacteroidota bacterium]